jgi:putative flavoprotein involved in K+ transport
MPSLDTIVIGAGQAGLAVSRCLSDRGVDHVVLERGRVGERWRTERWDSLRLLTPNWMSRLPSWSYDGSDPDGFMTATEVADFFARYARSADAPVEEQSAVESLRFDGEDYALRTASAAWTARRVVLATGWCDRPAIPAIAGELSPDVRQVAPNSYRNPGSVPDGGVLVVGASATGVQLANELRTAGRDVVLAVGRHSRLPRRYRGMDIFWWLDRIGIRDKTIDEMPDRDRARHEPSLQLVGGPDRRSVDLTTLQEAGVQITGRVVGIDGNHVRLADDLAHTVTEADRRMRRVLSEIDHHIDRTGLTEEVLAPEPIAPVRPAAAPDRIDLQGRGITSVVWATGHRRTYPWLHVPVLDEHGEIRQQRGVTPLPGLYVLGQHFQHARNSDSIDGVGRDAEFVADHLTCRTATTPRR